MKSYWLTANHDGVPLIDGLPLARLFYSGDLDAEPFRRRARGDEPLVQHNLVRSSGLRSLSITPGSRPDLTNGGGRHLTFIVEGELIVERKGASDVHISRGDILLIDGDSSLQATVRPNGHCRLLQLALVNPWDQVAPDAPVIDGAPANRTAANLKRMFRADSDLAYFRSFPELFPTAPNVWSPYRNVEGLRFVCFADGVFIDWHPEVVNQLVFVMSGELELEVSGDNAIERFTMGDICLAEDRTGIGHIDRMRGLTTLALIVIDDADLW